MSRLGPFEEDRHVMSREPMADYSWVLHKWVPKVDCPFVTEWELRGEETVRFLATLRTAKVFVKFHLDCDLFRTYDTRIKYAKRVHDMLDAQIADWKKAEGVR